MFPCLLAYASLPIATTFGDLIFIPPQVAQVQSMSIGITTVLLRKLWNIKIWGEIIISVNYVHEDI